MVESGIEVLVDVEVFIVQKHGLLLGRITPDIGERFVWLLIRCLVESLSDEVTAQRIFRFSRVQNQETYEVMW